MTTHASNGSSDTNSGPMLSDMDLNDQKAVEEIIQRIKNADLVEEPLEEPLEEHIIQVTEPQYEAITYPHNPNLLLSIRSGPGSGKTHTLVNRIAYLVGSEKIDPSKILVLSMANRSVKSLRLRLHQKIGHLANLIQISTFHSLAATTLETYGANFGTQFLNWILLDNSTWMSFLRFFSNLGVTVNGIELTSAIKPTALKDVISQVKSGKLLVKSAARIYGVDPEYIDALLQYLKENRLILYSDLIASLTDILELSVNLGQFIESIRKLEVVIVDEFQDMYPELLSMIQKIVEYPSEVPLETSNVKRMISRDCERTGSDDITRRDYEVEEIKLAAEGLTGEDHNNSRNSVETIENVHATDKKPNHEERTNENAPKPIRPLKTTYTPNCKHLTIAGDPNQSIYEFLGLDPDLMTTLDTVFPHHNVKEVILGSSFRLTPEILQFIQTATSFLVPQLINVSMPMPTIMEHSHHEDEARSIVAEIVRLITLSGGLLKPLDFAVLTRSNHEHTFIMKCMLDCGLEATRIALTEPWLTHSTYHFVHFLMVLRSHGRSQFPLLCCLQVFDTNSSRVLRLFNKGIDLESFFQLKDADKEYSRSRPVLAQIRLFLQIILLARENPPNDVLSTLEFLWDISNKTKFLEKSLSKESLLSEDILSFHKSLQFSYLEWTGLGNETQGMFLDHFLYSYNESVPNYETEKVNISTVHSAKGLEFPVVFLAGTFALFGDPYWQSILSDASSFRKSATPQDIFSQAGNFYNKQEAEKARLFYVATTRARQLLYVSKKSGNLNQKLNSVSSTMGPEQELGMNCNFRGYRDIIAKLAKELSRPLPNAQQFIEGERLYRQFNTSFRPTTLKGVCRTLRTAFRR